MCGVATILMKGLILVNKWLEFHFHKQPKSPLFILSDTIRSQITNQLLINFQPGHSPENPVEHRTSHTEMHFLGQCKPYSSFFAENRAVEPFYCCVAFKQKIRKSKRLLRKARDLI